MEQKKDLKSKEKRKKPILVTIFSVLLSLITISIPIFLIVYLNRLSLNPEEAAEEKRLQIILAGILLTGLFVLVTIGFWKMKNWARTAFLFAIILFMLAVLVQFVFSISASIFAGERIIDLPEVASILVRELGKLLAIYAAPVLAVIGLTHIGNDFEDTPRQRNFIDSTMRYLLLITALSAVFIVFLIIIFTMIEAWDSIEQIGVDKMLVGTIWRPGQEEYGLIPMLAGSILSTFGAALIGVPLSLAAAILLAEVAPHAVRETLRPAIELLAGIPSVVYGLFGMVVLAPLIRLIDIPRNTGYGLLNASLVLAIMIMPTITNIAEDAIRSVPKAYKNGSLALGATHWQTIVNVILPAARSGIIAAIILGIGRALGETMALIMVIGNSIAIPAPLQDGNILSIFLSTARTLTGNIAVEINYAAGAHRSALFFTGVLLFVMIFLVNNLARFLMRER
ncbi:MAG: phosphate ABC transporter permease subunit PstC [Anaerolineales bacterium]|nr:phosphate ABC transporter permease subunit PstC [Anaerolineales bacterium]